MKNFDVAIIGAGPAGYSAAEQAGKAGLKVVLFEKKALGGVCLNEGCIPTKTLLYSAKLCDASATASKYGITMGEASCDLPKIIARKSKVVRKLVAGVKAKLTQENITLIQGEAEIKDTHTLMCNGEAYSFTNLLLCTGSESFIPAIKGIDSIDYWTHREALENKTIPVSLTILGGGVIGMEFASFFRSLGTQVTVIEMMDEILPGTDREIAAALRTEYTKKGVNFLLNSRVTEFAKTGEGIRTTYQTAENTLTVLSEKVLICVGRKMVVTGFGLQNLALELENGKIRLNEKQQTSIPHVYVCGDLTGKSLLAHTAIREAEVAINCILGKSDRMSYNAIPGVIYTNPEVAGIGETEESMKLKGIPYKAIQLPMTYSGRFIAENEGITGLCKIILKEDETIAGAHLLGNPASEIITIIAMAIETNMTMENFKKIVFPHPTVSEIIRETLLHF